LPFTLDNLTLGWFFHWDTLLRTSVLRQVTRS
jgi:hypothetical protein